MKYVDYQIGNDEVSNLRLTLCEEIARTQISHGNYINIFMTYFGRYM